jgi:aryl-alcohol dehydrogenase-like predicted oxidoreductase
MAERGSLAVATSTFEIAGKKVARLGFGSMRLTGRGIWGEPDDRAECVAVVRRAVELGVQLIDTADSYGPYVAEEIIREALYPYPDDVVIATKAGLTRNGPDVVDGPDGPLRLGPKAWPPVGRPEYLRQEALMSMRRLGLDQIDLFQLHQIDPAVPLADQVGELGKLKDEGKIVAIGLSRVTVQQLAEARGITEISTVQCRYNVADRASQGVLDVCARDNLGFIPWAPMAQGGLDQAGPLARIAQRHGATPGQAALAWLLAASAVMLPIPGTSKRSHLEENLRSADIKLSAPEIRELDALS